MKNTNKLRRILTKYDVNMHIDEDNLLRMVIISKRTLERAKFEGRTWTALLNPAFAYAKQHEKV